jgi:hypothetical protein
MDLLVGLPAARMATEAPQPGALTSEIVRDHKGVDWPQLIDG